MLNFFQKIIAVLNELGVPYMLSGSMAMSVYVLPRATRDFDFVIHLKPQDAERFVAQFGEGYYCELDAVKDAVKRHSIFNVIDHASGYKADFVVLKPERYRQTEFDRRKEIEFFERKIYVVSPEDLLLSKLIWIQDYQSAVQMEDIKALLEVDGLDFGYIRYWITALQLKTYELL